MPEHRPDAVGDIRLAFALNLGFALLELVGGYWANSVAVLADALHDFGDSLALGLAWLLERKARKRRSPGFTYGYRRFSLLSALVNGLALFVGSMLALREAAERLATPEPVDTGGMLLLALVGMAVNGYAALRLKTGRTLNERVVSWHLLEDVLGWAAILIAAIVMRFTGLYVLDSILSLLIALFILRNVIGNIKGAMRVFLQGTPENYSVAGLERQISAIPGVLSVHDTHVWSMDGEYTVLSQHLVVAKDADAAHIRRIKAEALARLRRLDVDHVTLEIEFEDETCSVDDRE